MPTVGSDMDDLPTLDDPLPRAALLEMLNDWQTDAKYVPRAALQTILDEGLERVRSEFSQRITNTFVKYDHDQQLQFSPRQHPRL